MKLSSLLIIIATIFFLSGNLQAQDFKPLAVSASGQKPRVITPEDVLSIRELFEVKLSPDGKRIAFTVTEPNDPKDPRAARASNVWTVPADGHEAPLPLIPGLKNATSPHWAPDGSSLALLSDRGDGDSPTDKSTQVYLLRAGEKKAARLTSVPGGVEQFQWSPNSKMIAFIARDQPTIAEQERRAAGYDAIEVDGDSKFSRLWIANAADGKAVQVTEQDFEIREITWSPENNELALVINAPTPRSSDSGDYHLVVVDSSNGKVTRTLSKSVCGFYGVVRWSPDGDWMTFYDCPPNNDDQSLTLSLAPGKGGAIRPFLKDYQGTVWSLEWTPDSKKLLALSIEGTHQVVNTIDPVTGSIRKLTDVINSQWGASFSTNGETIAYLAQTPESASDVWVVEKNKTPRRLTDFNPQTKSWAMGKVSEVVWKNSKDGLTRRGVLIVPPDFKAGNSYPTVVNTHPGDTAWWTGFHASKWWDWGQLLASNGYVVFLPNTRGVTGEGGALNATINHWGGMAFQDLIDGVDYLIAQKIVDPNRLGIGGWSNGGFVTEYTITRTTRFKAAVAQAGHSNMFSLYGTSYLRSSLRRTSGKSPYYDREWYDEHSPITFVKNCRTPTLLLHGEFDAGVPVGQAYEFYSGLKDAGVETQLVIYPRERHNIQEYPHKIDLQNRMLAWFDKHLK